MVIRFGLSPKTCENTFALIWINGGEPRPNSVEKNKGDRIATAKKYYFLAAAAVIFLAAIAFAANEHGAAHRRASQSFRKRK
jgi:hypothetical protein